MNEALTRLTWDGGILRVTRGRERLAELTLGGDIIIFATTPPKDRHLALDLLADGRDSLQDKNITHFEKRGEPLAPLTRDR